jgi:HPt (histidine-containing phosphotransfer) domain-containing protein
MESTAQSENVASDRAKASDFAAALDLLWRRFLPEIRQRVELLAAAAADCAANQLSTAQCEAAHAAAHKLAGTLGTFNLAAGTELAREFELQFAGGDTPDARSAGRLASIAAELRAIVDSRK